jgi:hypothetical protein
MKFKFFFLFTFFFLNSILNANELDLSKKFIPLKDFIILKYELFFKENVKNIFQGGGLFGVAYQNVNYNIKIDKDDNINISVDAVMDKERYRSKRYYPKLRDCNQVRNKIFMNQYGYSFLTQKFNNLVNEESLTNSINNKILNISSLDDKMKKSLLNQTSLKINIIHPREEKSIFCSGKILDTELK